MRFNQSLRYKAIHGSLLIHSIAIGILGVSTVQGDRPNIVIMMADDLGYSDIGCYGSEIATPHLDALAAGGARFSQFYNTAKCHSSRVSLLTGQYCLAAGDTALTHGVTSAEVLAGSGYFTAMTGKWHLKKQPTDLVSNATLAISAARAITSPATTPFGSTAATGMSRSRNSTPRWPTSTLRWIF